MNAIAHLAFTPLTVEELCEFLFAPQSDSEPVTPIQGEEHVRPN